MILRLINKLLYVPADPLESMTIAQIEADPTALTVAQTRKLLELRERSARVAVVEARAGVA